MFMLDDTKHRREGQPEKRSVSHPLPGIRNPRTKLDGNLEKTLSLSEMRKG